MKTVKPRSEAQLRGHPRYAGLDITVHQSDQRRAPGHLMRQGPPMLRWALFEAAQAAARRTGSPWPGPGLGLTVR